MDRANEPIEKLISALEQSEPTATIRAVWRLALTRDPRALKPLKRLVERAPDPHVVREAQDAISQIEYACRRHGPTNDSGEH